MHILELVFSQSLLNPSYLKEARQVEKEIKKEPMTERRDRWLSRCLHLVRTSFAPHQYCINLQLLGTSSQFMFRYDRERSRSGSPKRKEYSREERKNGKKKDRRCWICLKYSKARALYLLIFRDRSSSPRDRKKDRRRYDQLLNSHW